MKQLQPGQVYELHNLDVNRFNHSVNNYNLDLSRLNYGREKDTRDYNDQVSRDGVADNRWQQEFNYRRGEMVYLIAIGNRSIT